MSNGTAETAQQWRRTRLATGAAFAAALIAVPTLFSIFPSWTRWPVCARVALVVAWGLAALAAAALTARADDRLHRVVEADQQALVRAEHRATLRDQFETILAPGVGGLPGHCHVTVYAPTPDARFLIPVYPPAVNLEDPAIFPAGAGATGKAWDDPAGLFLVTGPAVADPTHGLTSVQQRRYKMFSMVAAVVIRGGVDNKPIGVLTAISREQDRGDDQGLVETMKDLAEGIAWLIPAAVRWMMPEQEGEL